MDDAVADAAELVRETFPTARWAVLAHRPNLDPVLAQRWEAAGADREAAVALAREVLDRAGGPLFDGYVRPDPRRPR